MNTTIGIKKIDKLLLKIGRRILDNKLEYEIQQLFDELLITLKREGEKFGLYDVISQMKNLSQSFSQRCVGDIDGKHFYSMMLDRSIQVYLKILDYQIENSDFPIPSYMPQVSTC